MDETRYEEQVSSCVKDEARRAVFKAVKSGEIVKPSLCEGCHRGDFSLSAHHESYKEEDWLKVKWLCPKCHSKADKKRRFREYKQCVL